MKYLSRLFSWIFASGLATFEETEDLSNEASHDDHDSRSEDSGSDDLPNEVSLDDHDDERDKSYLINEEELEKIQVKIIDGDKEYSKWLVVDDIYICHRYQGSEEETFWECSGRRKYKCPFKLGTFLDADGDIRLSFMYKLECHDCGQNKLGPIMHIFKSTLKHRMKGNYKAKFHKIFNEEKKLLINRYSDNPGL